MSAPQSCTKVGYATWSDAQAALKRARARRRRHKGARAECDVYRCDWCAQWHLTSQPSRQWGRTRRRA